MIFHLKRSSHLYRVVFSNFFWIFKELIEKKNRTTQNLINLYWVGKETIRIFEHILIDFTRTTLFTGSLWSIVTKQPATRKISLTNLVKITMNKPWYLNIILTVHPCLISITSNDIRHDKRQSNSESWTKRFCYCLCRCFIFIRIGIQKRI